MTGYDLCKSFRASGGLVWHAPDSQIYPELNKMEAVGLLSSELVPWGPSTTKKEYSITAAGVHAFHSWMDTTLEYSRERDPVHLKAAYFEWAKPTAARAQLRAHIEHYEARRQQWDTMIDALLSHTDPTLARRLENFPPDTWEAITEYKVFSYRGLVGQAEQQIQWAKEGLLLIDRLSPDADAGSDETSAERSQHE
jgi:PadR family transcriptional regulator AphA